MDAWIGVALMIFSAWFWILSSDFPDAAKLFPRTFLAITFVLAAVLVVSTIRHNKMNPPEESSKKSDIQDTLLIIKAYLFMAIYFICIRVVGFFTSTTVFLVGFMYIRTHNTDLKKRLAAYAEQHPDVCRQTDADPETGCMEFDIEKGRFSFRLTAPYSEERREAARRYARESNVADRLK